MKTLLRTACAAALLALLVPAAPAHAAAPVDDHGAFLMSVNARPLGREEFAYETHQDSMLVRSELYQTIRSTSGPDTLHKSMVLIVGAFDYGLRQYQSSLQGHGHRLTRSVVAHDTTLSAYREVDGRGDGNVYLLPPGRCFVMDGGVWTLFDVICRSLAGRTFSTRPLNVVALGPRDSVLVATVRDRGRETVRWGGRSLNARRLELTDGQIHYDVWAGPDGRMLRLEQAAMQVRVEREAPALKPRAPRPPAR